MSGLGIPGKAIGLSLILLSGCDGEDQSTALTTDIIGAVSTVAALDVETRIAVGGWTRTIHGEGRATLPTGPLSVQVVVTESEELVASFQIVGESRADWLYYADLYVDLGDPRDFAWICAPTVQSAAVQHRPPGLVADSLYLTWYGLPVDAIC